MDTTTPQKVRLSDIATAANISLSAASMALSDHPSISAETKQLVYRLSKKLNYRQPRERKSLVKKLANTKPVRFGFMVIGTRAEDEVFAAVFHVLTVYAKALNVRLEVSSIEEVGNLDSIRQQVSDFIRDLDGLIIQGLIDKPLLTFIEKTNIPYVIQGNVILKPGEFPPTIGHFITTDFHAMGYLAAGRLMACGHRRIGFICEKIYLGLYNHGWLAGYRQAHDDAGMDLDPALIHVAEEVLVGGRPAARYFSAMANAPTAYVIPDFRVGASFLNEMQNNGIQIPRESIILGGMPDVAVKYHLENYPSICGDNVLFHKVTLDTLYRLYQKPLAHFIIINIPFRARNFPEPNE